MTGRKMKISADISECASNMLNDLVVKHERSKGWLLDKMIRTYCGNNDSESKYVAKVSKEKKAPTQRFKPPTVEEVFNYCNERCNSVDAQEFVDHYTTNNWMRGKTKIKDWKACVRTWEKSAGKKAVRQSKTSGNLSACEDFINER